MAAWAFMFSLLFSQKVPILFWWQITESIFCAGVGIAIIGGLYWKKGTTVAAWTAAQLVGSLLSGAGILLLYYWGAFVGLSVKLGVVGSAADWPPSFPLNFMWVSLAAATVSVVVYAAVSLATSKKDFDLNAMLHRDVNARVRRKGRSLVKRVGEFLGFDEDFTFWDKVVTGGLFAWSLLWLVIAVGGSVWNSRVGLADIVVVGNYWKVAGIWIPIVVAAATFVWFGIGSVVDIRDFFRTLRTTKRNALDDGSVGGREEIGGRRWRRKGGEAGGGCGVFA